MAYRPTISVYIDGQIADLGSYRNWQDEDLFYEALAMAAVFHDCKTIRAYRDRRYGTQKMYYLLDPERIENTQENLKELEADELITRTVYPQIPPKVEYTLTDRGSSLVKILDKLCDWGIENRK